MQSKADQFATEAIYSLQLNSGAAISYIHRNAEVSWKEADEAFARAATPYKAPVELRKASWETAAA